MVNDPIFRPFIGFSLVYPAVSGETVLKKEDLRGLKRSIPSLPLVWNWCIHFPKRQRNEKKRFAQTLKTWAIHESV